MISNQVQIVIKDKKKRPSLLKPFMDWLKVSNISPDIIDLGDLSRLNSECIRIWILKDDDHADIDENQINNMLDFTFTCTAPAKFNVLHPIVSISKTIAKSPKTVKQFKSCSWTCSNYRAKEVATSILNIPENKVEIIEDKHMRLGWHLALTFASTHICNQLKRGYKVLEECVGKEQAPELFNRVVKPYAKMVTEQYEPGHVNGAVARGDISTHEKHKDYIQQLIPELFDSFMLESEFQIHNYAIESGNFSTFGFENTYWNNKYDSMEELIRKSRKEVVENVAHRLIQKTLEILPIKPLLLSTTVFNVDVMRNRRDIGLVPDLSGTSFIYSYSKVMEKAFKEQVTYYLNDAKKGSISKKFFETSVDEIYPYLILPESNNPLNGNLFYDIETSNYRKANKTITDLEPAGNHSALTFGDRTASNYQEADGWFPLDYKNIGEMVIPICDFSENNMPVLSSIIIVIANVEDLLKITLRHLYTISALDSNKSLQFKTLIEKAREDFLGERRDEVLELMTKLKSHFDSALDEINPFRLWVANNEVNQFSSKLRDLFTEHHDVRDWVEDRYFELGDIWTREKNAVFTALSNSNIENLYELFFEIFDDNSEQPTRGYVAKSFREGPGCSIHWINNALSIEPNIFGVNTFIEFSNRIQALPFCIALLQLKKLSNTQIEVNKTKINVGLLSALKRDDLNLTITIETTNVAESDLSNLLEQTQNTIKTIDDDLSKMDLSANQTSSILALIVAASKEKDLSDNDSFVMSDQTLTISLRYTIRELN